MVTAKHMSADVGCMTSQTAVSCVGIMRPVIQSKVYATHLTEFNVESALVLDSKFTGCLLEGGMLSDAVMVRCQFKGVSLYWAHMFRTLYLECSFEDVDFRGANMAESMFVRCTLKRCDFSEDNLGGTTDLEEVTFESCERIGCKYSASSKV